MTSRCHQFYFQPVPLAEVALEVCKLKVLHAVLTTSAQWNDVIHARSHRSSGVGDFSLADSTDVLVSFD